MSRGTRPGGRDQQSIPQDERLGDRMALQLEMLETSTGARLVQPVPPPPLSRVDLVPCGPRLKTA